MVRGMKERKRGFKFEGRDGDKVKLYRRVVASYKKFTEDNMLPVKYLDKCQVFHKIIQRYERLSQNDLVFSSSIMKSSLCNGAVMCYCIIIMCMTLTLN